MKDKKQDIDEKQLARFLIGECTTEEISAINTWIKASESNQHLLDQVESIWLETGKLKPAPVPVDTKQAWQKMSTKIDGETAKEQTKVIPFKRIITSIAAAIILAIGVFQLFNDRFKSITPIELASNDQLINKELPDGSNIALNLNTTISYPKRFGKEQRSVKLEGEAFFEIESNPDKPFIIQTQQGYIQVLGTSFNVNAHPDKDLTVDVATGIVKVFTISTNKDTIAVTVKAGNRALIKYGNLTPEFIDEGDSDAYFWNNKSLVFKETKLKTVLEVLERRYKVQIELSNPNVGSCKYTGQFSNADIDSILSLIATTFNFSLDDSSTTYKLIGNGCFQN